MRRGYSCRILRVSKRMTKRFVQQGRNERKAEAYSLRYVEALNDVRTTLADLCVILTSGAFRRRTRATHNVAGILRTESRPSLETHPSRVMREPQHGHQDIRRAEPAPPVESQAVPVNLPLSLTQQKP